MLSDNFAYPKLMHYFEEISMIPRPSYHEERIADYLVAFAKERGLEYWRDEAHNVLINMPASAGYENVPPILLQGHTDMVCEKNEGVEHDFMKAPLKLCEEDGWIRAEGTTLGADNGVAVAVMLTLLDGEACEHPALQCLFTSAEEVGLDGAKTFDYERIFARRMLNMDSADDTHITVGCAGGLRSSFTMPISREACALEQIKIQITGLAGGHSGEDIHRSRANANKLLGRVLNALDREQEEIRLVSVCGGSKDNAIPRESEVTVAVSDIKKAYATVERVRAEIKDELFEDDAEFDIKLSAAHSDEIPMDAESTKKTVFILFTPQIGAIVCNPKLSGVVEYSRNLGVIRSEAEEFGAVFNSRSARESQIELSIAELEAYASLLGAKTEHYNRYPGWVYAESSPLRDTYAKIYRRLIGKDPVIEVIHAGLECAIIKSLVPDMDIISCGPVVLDLHSPDEKMSKASFERFFSIVLELLKEK